MCNNSSAHSTTKGTMAIFAPFTRPFTVGTNLEAGQGIGQLWFVNLNTSTSGNGLPKGQCIRLQKPLQWVIEPPSPGTGRVRDTYHNDNEISHKSN